MPKSIILNQVKEFVALDAGQENVLLEKFEEKSYSKKSILLQKGYVSRNEYFIVKGCLRVFVVDKDGAEHTLSLNIENWWCGDLKSFIRKEPATFNIVALEDTKVLQLSRNNWDNLLIEFPQTEKWFRTGFQNAIMAQQERIVQNISFTAEERFLAYLKKYPNIFQRVPQKYVASYLGMTPEFLSILRRRMINS